MVVAPTKSQKSHFERRSHLGAFDINWPSDRLRTLTDLTQAVRLPGLLYTALILAVCYTTSARAQFGLKCDSPAFAYSLSDAKLSEDVRAAIRATCAFNKKRAEIRQVFGKSGWSWDLLPKAQADVAELKDLANEAAELNFKTADPRALGNIRNMYIYVGNQQRWLADEQKKFVIRQQKLTTSAPGVSAPAESSQAAGSQTFVFVIFQDNISNADKDAFLQAYSVSIVDGPNPDQSYRLRLEEQVSHDQLQLVLNSMNSQAKIVKTAFTDAH